MNTTKPVLNVPVLIIGNGPVGQTASLLLAHWGIASIVVDQREARDAIGSKAIAQQRDILDIWDTLDGAGRVIASEGVTWSHARTYYRDAELFCTVYTDEGSAFPPFVNISQTRTEQILDERVVSQPLIDVRWGHEATGIDQSDDHVSVTCKTSEGEVTLRAAYVLACVGARGRTIRDALNVDFDGRAFGDQFLICDIKADLPGWERERRFYFDPEWNPGRQVLIHSCPDSTYRIDWQVPEDFHLDAEERDGRLASRIKAVIGDRDYSIVWKSVYRFQSRLASRLRVGRVLLVGDAAHLVSPFGGRGLNSGVQDAENAAWKVAAVLRGYAGESLLESYHVERHAAAAENLAVTGATMEFLVPQSAEEHARRRRVLERAVHDEAARSEVDSGRLAEPFWYVESPLTTPDSLRPFAGRPPKGAVPPPAPGLLIPDVPIIQPESGTPSRLRLLARHGFTVLAGDDVQLEPLRTEVSTLDLPVAFHRLRDLAESRNGKISLGADEVWLVRPDGHLAASLHYPQPGDLEAAALRAVGNGAGDRH